MKLQKKGQHKVPVVNFCKPESLESFLTHIDIPRALQEKRKEVKEFTYFTKKQIEDTMKDVYFFQQGSCAVNGAMWYQVYGDLEDLLICLFNENEECIQSYLFPKWAFFAMLETIKN